MKSTSSATTSSREGSRPSPSTISRSAHGLPCAPRPTITAAAPVVASTACARAREVMSPEAITGTSTSETSSAVSEWSAVPGVHLLRRAGVQGERRRARLDELRADLEARPRAVAQPAAHLHATRAGRPRSATASTIAQARAGVVEQRRAGAGLRHLAHRAAEVDVDEVGARRLDHPRRVGHHARLRAEDLDRERMLVAGDAQVAERPLVPVLDPGAADHLGADEPGAEPASLAAERLHADARHRRQDDARRDLDVADPPALSQVDLHGCEMVDARY